ncbi:MAG: hypothetical protein AAFV53_29355 [Myxococcota bacterium]
MIFVISILLVPFVFKAANPAPGLWQSRTASRTLDCERLKAGDASREYPGEVKVSGPRGDFVERSALICRERLMRPGLRAAADEAVLRELEATVSDLATVAASLQPDLEARTWLVEAYHPSGPVSGKISFATKNALVGAGLRVSDRTPILSAKDIEVITRMPPSEAYPTACARYFATGGLGEDDALLAVVNRDPRETILHAGLCVQGRWTWVQ